MSAIVPLSGGKLPAYLSNRAALATINADVASNGRGFPVLSIKGKVFTLVKDGERKVLTRPDDPDEVLQSITVSVIRANTKNRVYYAAGYDEDGADGASNKPDCYSSDGVAPAADARDPQSKKCQLCPHAVWGSKSNANGKGTACSVNTRLSITDPDSLTKADEVEPYLLRVPAGSRSNFAEVVKVADNRGIPYNALVLKVGFDKEAPAPKLTFKLVGLLDDAAYTKSHSLYDDETVLDMLGLGQVKPAAPVEARPEPESRSATEADLEAALAIRAAKAKPTATEAAPQAAVEDTPILAEATAKEVAKATGKSTKPKAEKPAPVEQPKAEVVQEDTTGMDNLLGDLDALLADTDD